MDKHWRNLLITETPDRGNYGKTQASKAHRSIEDKAAADKRALEMGQAFCNRARVNLPGLR